MFHQLPPTNNRRHLIDKNLHLLATRFYRRDSVIELKVKTLRERFYFQSILSISRTVSILSYRKGYNPGNCIYNLDILKQ